LRLRLRDTANFKIFLCACGSSRIGPGDPAPRLASAAPTPTVDCSCRHISSKSYYLRTLCLKKISNSYNLGTDCPSLKIRTFCNRTARQCSGSESESFGWTRMRTKVWIRIRKKKFVDPNAKKMNSDPQHCSQGCNFLGTHHPREATSYRRMMQFFRRT
jgi:hypothetical protein